MAKANIITRTIPTQTLAIAVVDGFAACGGSSKSQCLGACEEETECES